MIYGKTSSELAKRTGEFRKLYLSKVDQEYETQRSAWQQEDWMHLTQLSLNTYTKEIFCEGVLDSLNKAYAKYTTEHINSMSFWIENQKVNDTQPSTLLKKSIDISMLIERQELVCDIVNQHFNKNKNKQVLMIITGPAGSGKSFLIGTVK